MPFDLTTVLGHSVREPEVTQLIEYFEEKPHFLGPADPGDCYCVQFRQSGFFLDVNGADIVYGVTILTRAHGYYHACTDGLPFGLTEQSTRTEARKLFGPPTHEDGPIREFIPPQNIIYRDRWDHTKYFVQVTYSEQCDSVLEIILEPIRTPASNES